jgi:hypothetical protein
MSSIEKSCPFVFGMVHTFIYAGLRDEVLQHRAVRAAHPGDEVLRRITGTGRNVAGDDEHGVAAPWYAREPVLHVVERSGILVLHRTGRRAIATRRASTEPDRCVSPPAGP